MSDDALQWPEAEERQPQPQWQQRQATPQTPTHDSEVPPSLVVPANRVYVPYDKCSRPEDLIFFCAKLPALGAAYPHLQDYSFDQFHGRFFTLYYPSKTAHVTGQGLLEIVYHIISRKCAIIREWHRDLYDPPTRGIPVIETIEILPVAGAEP